MSLRILVVPEDPTLDQYIIKPILRQACKQAGKPSAIVRVATNPHASGISTVLNEKFLQQLVDRNNMVNLFLLCVDRDGDPGRDAALAGAVQSLQKKLRPDQGAGGRAAHQEVEIWGLAAHAKTLNAKWSEIRSDPDVKDTFFQALVDQRGIATSPGRGREILGREAADNYQSLRTKCPEILEFESLIQGFAN